MHTAASSESVLGGLDMSRLTVSSALSAPRRSASPATTTSTVDRWNAGGGGGGASTSKDIFSMADMFIADVDGRSGGSGKATPPMSMVHRQKVSYHCQFGDSGEGDGQFTEPSGVAVNMITGDILVADANNHRVQVGPTPDIPDKGPLPSDRQHLSYGVCLEVRGKIIRTVLCCIVYYSCTQS